MGPVLRYCTTENAKCGHVDGPKRGATTPASGSHAQYSRGESSGGSHGFSSRQETQVRYEEVLTCERFILEQEYRIEPSLRLGGTRCFVSAAK